jgi:hypothetical protein
MFENDIDLYQEENNPTNANPTPQGYAAINRKKTIKVKDSADVIM